MGLEELLLQNIVTFFLIFGMLGLALQNHTFDRRTNIYFLVYIVIVFVQVLANMSDVYFSYYEYATLSRHLASAVGYVLPSAAVVCVISVFLRRRHLYMSVLWAGVAFTTFVTFASIRTGWVFRFSETNSFVRGPLGFLPHIIGGCYMFLLLVLTIHFRRTVELGELLVVLYLLGINVFSIYLEVVTERRFILPATMMISCTIYYIFLYIDSYKRDQLTGLLNRRSLYADVKRRSRQKFAVISMDLNGLKELNDTKGHAAGDEALKALADACTKACDRSTYVYRTGGDEFIAIALRKTPEQTDEYIRRVTDALKKTPYMASFGKAMYDGTRPFDEVCNDADVKMYEDKSHYKRRSVVQSQFEKEPRH